MGGSWRAWAVALAALAVVALPLAPCACAAMAAAPTGDGHCGAPEEAGAALVSSCRCVCMSSAPELAAFRDVNASVPAPGVPTSVAALPGLRSAAPATRQTGRSHSPPRPASSVLRI